jgi:hypothetical protein
MPTTATGHRSYRQGMDFTISALAAERVADLRRDVPDASDVYFGRHRWLRHPLRKRRKAGRGWTPRPA